MISDGFMGFCWENLPPRARAQILSGAPRTLWLFGAGASHHYGLNRFGVQVPLANGFFKAFQDLPTSQGFQAHVGPFISFLQHYRGVLPEDVPSFDENVEDFMTSIESDIAELAKAHPTKDSPEEEKNFGDKFSLSTVFNNMHFIFANVINESQNGASPSLYRSLLDICEI